MTHGSLAEALLLVAAGRVGEESRVLALHSDVIFQRDVADLDVIESPTVHDAAIGGSGASQSHDEAEGMSWVQAATFMLHWRRVGWGQLGFTGLSAIQAQPNRYIAQGSWWRIQPIRVLGQEY